MKIILQTPAPSLEKSIQFYSALKFSIISDSNQTYAQTNGLTIQINDNSFARLGVKLFAKGWETIIKELKLENLAFKTEEGFIINSPSGCRVYLEKEKKISTTLTKTENTILGNFAGLSLETATLKQSISFWQAFGFSQTSGNPDQGWVALSNESNFTISLMKPLTCPHQFINPSLTFFNGKENLQIINQIKALKIPIVEEITIFNKEGIVDNIIVQDPGGLGAFIFND